MPSVYNGLDDPQIADVLLGGAVGVLPTDTVYGLVCVASNQASVERLYKLKNRDNKPGTLIAANIEQLVGLGIKARYLRAVQQFWPGAISVEIPHSVSYLNQATGRQAMRVTDSSNALLKLVNIVGPLLTSSANQPGEPPANTIAEAQKYFGDRIDFYVDGGDLSGCLPSTLIRIIDDAIEVLRPGAVQIDETTGKILS